MAARTSIESFLMQQHAIMSRADASEALCGAAAAGVRVLLVTGGSDALIPPAAARELHRRITAGRGGCSATLQVIGDCGHLSPLEQPQAVSTALVAHLLR